MHSMLINVCAHKPKYNNPLPIAEVRFLKTPVVGKTKGLYGYTGGLDAQNCIPCGWQNIIQNICGYSKPQLVTDCCNAIK